MNKTQIEWVKNPDGSQGYTWNPITGCLNGCSYCYAKKLAYGRLKQRYLANKNTVPLVMGAGTPYKTKFNYQTNDPFYPRFWENRLYELRGTGDYDKAHPDRNLYNAQRTKDKGIFVCDMGELFGDWVPQEWTKRVMEQIKIFAQHRFYLLTKQPQNLPKWSPFPENCWVGVTATEQHYFVRAVSELRFIEAKIKYLSFEPLLGHIPMLPEALTLAGINWLIIGAQTKPYKPPKIEWVEEIVEAADKARIPVFLKDNLRPILKAEGYSKYPLWANWQGTLRQEMPR